ncbi:hypothetical protein ETD83_02475 [Actinomadura soli]|uniref:Uncharacterized protein n=1 Tax=Actinomadura soli TaxID=2508997 RepID=A0A5C4JJ06_9ACTN|nr:hypothetical protein [Actinomadura soli]TMR06906.1 hypothetical protein ETD83_02475 [Actinomadura soli]
MYLRRLHALTATRVGWRGAEVLSVLAGIEEHRAAGASRGVKPPSWWFVALRIVIGGFFLSMAAIIAVPDLDGQLPHAPASRGPEPAHRTAQT